MPYKDKESEKEYKKLYQREYMKKKRQGSNKVLTKDVRPQKLDPKSEVKPIIPTSYSTKSIESDIEKALGGRKSPYTQPFSKAQQVRK